MALSRLMIIRHAEKPDADGQIQGVEINGANDPDSLIPRGWQRAGALVGLFFPPSGSGDPSLIPGTIFASLVGHHSHSQRPEETVTPLAQKMGAAQQTPFVTIHPMDDLQGLVTDALSRNGTALICWEHHRIPEIVALLPNAPTVPQHWPGHRFDMVWIFDRTATGWNFIQKPQLLLDGDSPDPIS